MAGAPIDPCPSTNLVGRSLSPATAPRPTPGDEGGCAPNIPDPGHVARHTSTEFLAFLDQLVAAQPQRRALHLIADNFAAHKTKAVAAWLGAHRPVTMHYTPTYSSWLNQIELWLPRLSATASRVASSPRPRICGAS